MKDEALQKFRKEFTTYAEAVDSDFSEIDELEKELAKVQGYNQLLKSIAERNDWQREKEIAQIAWGGNLLEPIDSYYQKGIDTRTSEIEKLREELANNPKYIRLKELYGIRKKYKKQRMVIGLGPSIDVRYTGRDYAYFATKPTIEEGDTYRILLRQNNSNGNYDYVDVERIIGTHVVDFSIKPEEKDEFEKTRLEEGYLIVPIPTKVGVRDLFEIKKQFFLDCVDKDPEEVKKQMIKKYGESIEQRN